MLRRLPIGVQTFSHVRLDYDVYVDKTLYIYNMIKDYKVVFLSRPRRFGKSLTCSTLESIFANERKLFNGLAIEKTDWEWKEYPIIRLDTSAANFTGENGLKNLEDLINEKLENCAKKYEVKLKETGISRRFSDLIKTLYEKKGSVVVIVDEYDCPLLDTLYYPENHEAIRKELQGFYKVLKDCDNYLKFVFLTGVTKFSQVSLFSGMNQPKDISLVSDCSALCGITQEELENCFEPEINEYSESFGGRENYLDKLKNFYNGYRFSDSETSVYNPVSILNHFGDKLFRVYWAETGTPSFLAKFIDKNGADIADIENIDLPADAFGKYNSDKISLIPLMYQAGYLTIKDYDSELGTYKLGYPNVEVRRSFSEFLSEQYSSLDAIKQASNMNKLLRALQAGDVDTFMETIKIYMQGIKYDLITKMTEYYFEFAFSNILNMLGISCEIEVHSAIGSVDAVVKLQKNVFVIEAKLDKPVEEALKQIEEKRYYVPYMEKGCKIFKIGVVFGEKERNVVEWRNGE